MSLSTVLSRDVALEGDKNLGCATNRSDSNCCGLWVSILLSLKLQISRLFRAWSFLDIQAIIECRFTLKHVRDMIITYLARDSTVI